MRMAEEARPSDRAPAPGSAVDERTLPCSGGGWRGHGRTTARELKARLEGERRGLPFLSYRDANGRQCLLALDETAGRITVGRRSSSGVCLGWDEEVSPVHAELARVGEEWTLVDDGVSSNGSWVSGERVRGRRPLRVLARTGRPEEARHTATRARAIREAEPDLSG
jgi:hypothetical protein